MFHRDVGVEFARWTRQMAGDEAHYGIGDDDDECWVQDVGVAYANWSLGPVTKVSSYVGDVVGDLGSDSGVHWRGTVKQTRRFLHLDPGMQWSAGQAVAPLYLGEAGHHVFF